MTKKMGFYSVISLVIGSQVGTGILLAPADLARYGLFSFGGLTITSIGVIFLAIVFAELCKYIPKGSGPHAYVRVAFGDTAAFFTGWTYWLISWISSVVVIVMAITSLTPIIGTHSLKFYLILETVVLAVITLLNIKGAAAAGFVERILVILKLLPLLIVPIFAIFLFDLKNLTSLVNCESSGLYSLNQTSVYALWLFIGLECATTASNSVENPHKTIPRAVVIGTSLVAIIYLLNTVGIMMIVPQDVLIGSPAPYVEAAKTIFGGSWEKPVGIMMSIICIGTLNAWVLTSGQVAYSIALDKLFPSSFAKTNKYGAPYISLILSLIGSIPFLIFTADEDLSAQVTRVINISAYAFLLIYAVCMLAFLFLLKSRVIEASFKNYCIGFLALLFCSWGLWSIPFDTLILSMIFTISGIPVYIWQFRSKWFRKTELSS